MFVRTEEDWQARERELLAENNRLLERARAAEDRLHHLLHGRVKAPQPFEYDPDVDYLEDRAIAWVRSRIGAVATSPAERALRLLEEVLELAQAESLNPAVVRHLVDHVFARSHGNPMLEVGGVAFCLYAYCGAIGRHVADMAIDEAMRNDQREAASIEVSLERKATAGLLTFEKKV